MTETSKSRAWILDVGHGNSTVVEQEDQVSVIDGGRGVALREFLEERDIFRVENVLISHADADHMNGVSLLLSDESVDVKRLYVNPDKRGSALWNDFNSEVKDAKRRGTELNLELTDENPGKISNGNVTMEVLAPSQEMAMMTSNGHTSSGEPVTSNTMSAVVRVWAGDTPRLLLAADIDQVGLDSLLNNHPEVASDVVVFPHHGGRPGKSDPKAFARSIIDAVGADWVIFSIGRARYGTPRPDVVEGVLEAQGEVHVACTQLSTLCAAQVPEKSSPMHRPGSPCSTRNACCAGTIEVSLSGEDSLPPMRRSHLEFIRENAPTAICGQHD